MEIRYNRWAGGILLTLGGLNIILGIWLMLVAKIVHFSLLTALIITFLGMRYWQYPYFMVENGSVVILPLVGSLKREFLFRSPQDIKLENGKLFVQDGGQWKRVPVYRWFSHPGDWREMVKYVQSIGT